METYNYDSVHSSSPFIMDDHYEADTKYHNYDVIDFEFIKDNN